MPLDLPRLPLLKAAVKNFLISDDGKNAASVIKDFATVIALLLAGWWFFMRGEMMRADLENLKRRSEVEPKLNIEQVCTVLPIHPQKRVLSIGVKLDNKGATALRLKEMRMQVSQVLPLPDELRERVEAGYSVFPSKSDFVDWKVLDERRSKREILLNAGESDAENFEVEIPSEVTLVRIYTFIPSRENLGWRAVSYQDVHTK